MTRPTRGLGGTKSIAVWVVACVVLVVAAFMAGTRVSTPWDDAQDHAQTTILATVPVVQGEIPRAVVSLEASLMLGREIVVTVDPLSEGRAVVTDAALEAGDAVGNGDLLLEVSGRPLIGLVLPFPPYRDLRAGSVGRDVRALQEALTDLGHYSGSVDGHYGAGTSRAVELLYQAVGYSPPPPDDAARAALDEASTSLTELRSQEAAEPGSVSGSELQRAQSRLAAAQEAVQPWVPVAEIVTLDVGGARVESLAPVGTLVGNEVPAVHLQSGTPSVEFRVDLTAAPLFDHDTDISVSMPGDPSTSARGTVVEVSEFRPGDPGRGLPPGYDVRALVEAAPEWQHGAAVLVAPTTQSDRITGLVVPLVAVRSDADGTYVLVSPSPAALPDELRRVPVTLGAESAGRVIVSGEITDGDLVVTAMST